MTDVPFLALETLCLVAFVRGLRSGSGRAIVVGTLMACVATLTRQVGIVMPLAFGLAFLVKKGLRAGSLLRACAPPAVTVGVLLTFEYWLEVTARLPAFRVLQRSQASRFLHSGVTAIAVGFGQMSLSGLVYLGLFILPFLVLALRKASKDAGTFQRRIMSGPSLVALSAMIVVILAGLREWMPLNTQAGAILINFGLGPDTLRDVFFGLNPHVPAAPRAFWVIVTIVGAVGGALLLQHFLSAAGGLLSKRAADTAQPRRSIIVFLVSACLLFFAPIVTLYGWAYFDRYFLVMLPPLVLLVAQSAMSGKRLSRSSVVVSAAVIAVYAVFAVGATRDYLEWNKVRWQALNDLTQRMNVPPRDIDGGYEFNGWYNYDRNPISVWHLANDLYVVSFTPLSGYEEWKRYEFQRWMPPGKGQILVLRKTSF